MLLGRADTAWVDDLTVEKLETVLGQAGHDAAGLRDGEHISCPSAAEYRARVTQSAAFAGRTATGVRNAARLLQAAYSGARIDENGDVALVLRGGQIATI
jgi:hypothetical protein